ncbi:DUF1365 domain-containing protein [Glaciecola sp. MF2-115]|uniref:DUF1365 domain-containing protein n=1 Tax=Glaciecola sp. MF2-115 TaxID=3384827 RepID=UPI0039A07571
MTSYVSSTGQANISPSVTESGLYKGIVHHQRFVPKVHRFKYNIYLFWLKLSELEQLNHEVKGFSNQHKGFSAVKFLRSDYLGDPQESLETSVLSRMSELNGTELSGDIYFLGQLRTFGWYFSPVNFYYLRNNEGVYTHMLAEVSNTPWDKRHHYLVDLAKQENSEKAFHVSPFNPMDMTYQWKIKQPNTNLRLHLSCIKQEKHFEAALDMKKEPLTTKTLRSALISIPSMTLKTVAGIYWQAIKLFFKRIPIYMHP